MNLLMQTLKALLYKCIKDIDDGSCNLNDEELKETISIIQKYSRKDTPMSKYQAYTYLNVSRATFDNYVREGKIPTGQKVQGFTELVWFQKDLDKCIQEFKKKIK